MSIAIVCVALQTSALLAPGLGPGGPVRTPDTQRGRANQGQQPCRDEHDGGGDGGGPGREDDAGYGGAADLCPELETSVTWARCLGTAPRHPGVKFTALSGTFIATHELGEPPGCSARQKQSPPEGDTGRRTRCKDQEAWREAGAAPGGNARGGDVLGGGTVLHFGGGGGNGTRRLSTLPGCAATRMNFPECQFECKDVNI